MTRQSRALKNGDPAAEAELRARSIAARLQRGLPLTRRRPTKPNGFYEKPLGKRSDGERFRGVRWGSCAYIGFPPRDMRVWDEEQVRFFLAEAKRSSGHYPLYLMAILTGMRQGELLGLRWQDIDWTFGRASVRQTLVRFRKDVGFHEPKSPRSRRTIALPPVLLEELRGVQSVQTGYKRALGPRYATHDLIFCQPNGKPLHGHNITQRDFRSVIKRAKVPHIRFHDLRHCSATLLLRQGVLPKVVQERLGHSGIAITMDTYSHVLPGMQEDAATLLARRLVGSDTGNSRHLQNETEQDKMTRGKL